MVLQSGCSPSVCRGVCGVTNLGASPGQMSVILEGTAVVDEVLIQTFGAMDVGMLMLLAFFTCREHLSGYCPSPWHTELIHMLMGWQVVEVVCSICKIVQWPFHMF